MLDIETIVKEGNRSLAKEALERFRKFGPLLPITHSGVSVLLKEFTILLSDISDSGSIKQHRHYLEEEANALFCSFEMMIPEQIYPQDKYDTLRFALDAMMRNYGIADDETFRQVTGLKEIVFTSETGGVFEIMQDGEMKKVFFAIYLPEFSALSSLINAHEFCHAMQPEHNVKANILKGLEYIKGYNEFMEELSQDSTIREIMIRLGADKGVQDFIMKPEILKLARIKDVDTDTIKAYLKEKTPYLNFLSAYCEGEAYLTEGKIIGMHPLLDIFVVAKVVYRMMADVDCLTKVATSKTEELGIPMVQYILHNPEAKEDMFTNREFHEQITEKYFSKAKLSLPF